MSVVIRPWKPEDAAALSAVANNIKIWNNLRNRFPHPYTKHDADHWIWQNTRNPMSEHLCVETDGEVCGGIGFIPGKDVEVLGAEVGFFIGESYWGRGIATEAVKLLVQYLIDNYPFVRLYASVFANNPASMRVLEKNGFALEQVRKNAIFKNGEIMDDHVWVRLIR